LCPPNQPELATAISVKRIKCRADALGNVRINKLHELTKATDQANRLAEVGFHMVYSFVFVAIDTREQNNAEKISYEGLSAEPEQLVHSVVTVQELTQRVGLYRTDYVQSVDGNPLHSGTFLGCLLRNATPVRQADSLTEWISQVMLREEAIEPESGAPLKE